VLPVCACLVANTHRRKWGFLAPSRL
jgi:hypothetical protein